PGGSDPSERKACSTLPDEPAMTSAFPSPSTSAMAGAVGICQPSIGIGNELSQSPLAASQPPSRCSKSTFVAGADCAAAMRESTTTPGTDTGQPGSRLPFAENA